MQRTATSGTGLHSRAHLCAVKVLRQPVHLLLSVRLRSLCRRRLLAQLLCRRLGLLQVAAQVVLVRLEEGQLLLKGARSCGSVLLDSLDLRRGR